ncbi:hypothetical protein [Radiobacillus deserti]|uniref:Uncharacterized protein n=1 Tax=Radiobacillus deserti TaxID=2594883 RepID=A0A516KIJ8_9BACI|nr:hypothetical protein [Radiobacillus deserti]QDP41201.1 hypothetical protein FN924_14025 [Radiobacillus deserti]
MNRLTTYILWTAGILLIAFLGMEAYNRLREYSNETFELRPLVLFGTLFPVFLGFLTRLPKFLVEWKKPWKIDVVKLSVIGIPTFILMFIPVASFLNLLQIPPFLYYFAVQSPSFLSTLSGFVFGYVLLDSLKQS